jgi:hypothetical protein
LRAAAVAWKTLTVLLPFPNPLHAAFLSVVWGCKQGTGSIGRMAILSGSRRRCRCRPRTASAMTSVAFRSAVPVACVPPAIDHQAMTVLRQHVLQITGMGLLALGRLIQPHLGIGRRGVGGICPLLPLAIDAQVPRIIRGLFRRGGLSTSEALLPPNSTPVQRARGPEVCQSIPSLPLSHPLIWNALHPLAGRHPAVSLRAVIRLAPGPGLTTENSGG